ncbi:MAG: TonB-dependent receptor [Bacteroidales bacterium]|nr:TonB-dependent receptor [Bacteroidales bacterium]
MLRKVLLTIGLLVAANVAAFAQGTLKGTVTDAKTGEEMPFVNVIVKQDGQQVGGAQTDIDGIFTIRPLNVGTYTVEISYVCYQKFVKEGVYVKASGFTVCNAALAVATEQLKEVKVIADRVPLIEVGTPESGTRISDADIAHMPGTSVESIVAAVGGVGYDDGGTGTARGESGMVTMQGGVRKRTGISAPKEAIAEIQVILGGTPASIGEAIGGTQIITLKPPSNQFKGLVKYETWLDYRLANTLVVYLTGPIFKKKTVIEGGGVSERTLVGFRLTGQASYTNSGMYRARDRRYRMVNDELVYELEQAPISYDPINGINYAAETRLHSSDFVEMTRLHKKDFVSADRKPSLSSYSVAMEGAFNILFSDNVTMTVTGEFSYSLSPSISTSYLPLNMTRAANGVSNASNVGITVDFTQRFPDAKTSSEETKPAISNVMYNISAMYSRYKAKSYNNNFGDDVFKYGHIGKFVTEKERSYEVQYNYNYNGTEQVAYVQNSWRDFVDPQTFEASPYNPVLANYTAQLYNIPELAPYMTTFDIIRSNKGLVNGDSPSSVYSLFSNVGVQSSSYAKQENNYYYVQAKASAQIKKHELEVGFQYDQYTSAYYGLSAYSLWTIMRQSANAHITQLDFSNPHERFAGTTLFVDYDRMVGDGQTHFDASLREALGASAHEWLDIDRYSPEFYEENGGLSMFSANEMFNSGHSIVSFYGYDHTGEKYNGRNWNLDDFFDPKSRGHENYQYLPVFSPIYMAGYIQDKFYFQDLIFNVGVRVDRFDGNQMVLKDPYLLYESYTVGDLKNGGISYNTTLANNAFANNAKDDWVVYVDDPSAATPTITGYRSGSTWYNPDGVEVSSPTAVYSPISGKATPFRTTDGQKAYNGNESGNKISSSSFKDYDPQVVVMPRVAFSFPVGDAAQFKASYDIIARRPSSNWQADYLSYLYMTQVSVLNNPNLKPERITNYEVGFQQMLNKVSAISISAYYKETRDLIQLVQYAGADPNSNYYSYDNLDFKTIKGFTLSYDLRQTKNIRVNANYTLQYAEGTGLSSTTMSELIKEGYTTLKMLNPISDDRRHEFKANVDFRYAKAEGFKLTRMVTEKDENGVKQKRKKDIYPLENFGVNIMAVAQSGRPYTKAFSNTQQTIVGSYRGARLPWGFYFNMVVDKSWFIKVGKRQTILNAAITVNNLFDLRNVVGVFSVTGNPDDNGYLTDPDTQSTINSYLDPQSYRDLYSIYLINNYWNYANPRHIKLGLTYSF